jgi:hypothetical protein
VSVALPATLGVDKSDSRGLYAEWGDFSLASADDEIPVTRRLHAATTSRSSTTTASA